MFECKVYLHLPVKKNPDIEIAKYDFDPDLNVGDIVCVRDLEWLIGNRIRKKSFEAKVTMCRKVIEPKNAIRQNALIKLEIQIEVIDKEILFELHQVLEKIS